MADARAPLGIWHAVRSMPDFARLLAVRIGSQFGDGLFGAALAGALLFNPERAATPWEIATSFAVLFLPYSLVGPFAGALLDRWDRHYVLVAANGARIVMVAAVGLMLALRTGNYLILAGALIVNGLSRFVTSGLSAALPHVVPRDRVVTMNSVATAVGAVSTFMGAVFMLVPRLIFGADDSSAAIIVFLVDVPVAVAFVLSLRFTARCLGPDDSARAIHGSVIYAVSTGLLHGVRTAARTPSVAATLSGLAAHRMVFGINTLLMLVIVRNTESQMLVGLGIAAVFVAATGSGSFVATLVTPWIIRRVGRFAAANLALGIAAVMQTAAVGLHVPVLVVCGFLLGAAGQVVKLSADTAMQIDVDDALRGHVFAIQDSLFWVSLVVATAAAAAVIPPTGHSPALVLAGTGVYLAGLAVHAALGSRSPKS